VAGFFQLRDLGPFSLKGSSLPLEVHELEGAGALRTRLDLSRMRGFSRFVGRDAEMETLAALLDEALAGRGQVVGIVAEAGTGKSRLCWELAERCRARGVAVYEAHGVAHGRTIPFLPVLEMMRRYFGVGERDTNEEARRKVAGTLVLLDPALTADLPLVLDLLGVAETPIPPGGVDPEARQRALLEFNRRLIAARSLREPAMLVVEDLHWIDAGTEAFVASTIEAAAETRTLVVVNFRPEYHAAWMNGAGYRQLALAPLGAEATAALLGELLGPDPSTGDLGERIRERTQGNPFFIEELVQALAENGSLVGTRGAYRLAAPVAEMAIPPTVQAVLAARIDRLAEREKAVLQTAAVVGREFTRPVLAHVAGLPADDLTAALDTLATAGLVHETALYPEPEYAFRHPLTHEVAYRSQLSDRRARAHAAVAQAIIALDAGRLDERAALLATHFEAAGDAPEAARWHARAGLWIEVNYAAEAFRHWSRVRDLLSTVAETVETQRLRARACAELLKLPIVGGLGEFPDPTALFREGVACAERSGDLRVLALVHASYGAHLGIKAGDEEARVRHGLQAVELAVRAGDRDLEQAALLPVFSGLLALGRLDEALVVSERVLAIPGLWSGRSPARARWSASPPTRAWGRRGSAGSSPSAAGRGAYSSARRTRCRMDTWSPSCPS
jgi:adenylate cyclase